MFKFRGKTVLINLEKNKTILYKITKYNNTKVVRQTARLVANLIRTKTYYEVILCSMICLAKRVSTVGFLLIPPFC